jgi:hypothetical protein
MNYLEAPLRRDLCYAPTSYEVSNPNNVTRKAAENYPLSAVFLAGLSAFGGLNTEAELLDAFGLK